MSPAPSSPAVVCPNRHWRARTRPLSFGALLFVSTLLWSPYAQADGIFTAEGKNEDGSTPPPRTMFSGSLQGAFPGSLTFVGPAPEFPGTLTWTVQNPQTDPQELTFTGAPRTRADYYCGLSVCTGAIQFYSDDTDKKTCNGFSCKFTTKHWAIHGSVSGTVTLPNGMPVRNYPVVAHDPEATPLLSYSRTVMTDFNGFYTFTSRWADIYSFENSSPSYRLVDFPIAESNNWGLRVKKVAEDEPLTKTYWIQAGRSLVVTDVQSSKMTTVHLEIPYEDEFEEDPPNKRCDLSESEEEPICQDASMAGVCPGDPVSVITGNVFFDHTDVVLPGTVPLTLRRSYNSIDAFRNKTGLFGPGWSSSFEREISLLKFEGALAVKKSNGSRLYFSDIGGTGSFTPYSVASGRSSIVRMGTDYVRTLPSGRRETYDGNGRLASLADPVGNITTLERSSGLITAVVAPGGRRLEFTYLYTGRGPRVAAISGPQGTIATYSYDDVGRLIRTAYPDGSGYEYSYDDRGQLLQMRDLGGTIIESHIYSSTGQGLTSERGDGVERLTFSYASDQTTVTDASGNVTHYDLVKIDELTVVKKISGPCVACGTSGSDTQEWTHDSQARAASYKNGLGQVWSYTYDADGNRNTVTNSKNETTTYTFDSRGRILTVAPPGGGGQTYTYTDAGLVGVSSSLNHTASVSYTLKGDIASFTTARGKTYTFSRNAHGDVTSVADPLGRSTTYDVDSSGRPRAVTDPAGRTVHVRYDLRGRLAGVRLPTGEELTVAHDKGGRQTSATDPAGRTTRYTYDRYGRLLSVLDPMNGRVTLAYDRMSNVTSVTDPKHQTTRFTYDSHGRRTKVTSADGHSELYTYDSAGRPETRTDRRGIVTTYHRDVLGRPTGQSYSDTTPPLSYTYDSRSRLESVSNATDTLTWGYDEADNVVSETSARNESNVSYSYGVGGLRLTLGLDGADLIRYGWDDLSRLATLTKGDRVFSLGYDDASRRTSATYPNGVITSYAYNAASRLTRISALAGAETVVDANYGYDASGNRTSKGLPEFTETYGYDVLNRLTSVERNGASPAHWHYRYDAVGNRVLSQANDAVVTAAYGAANRLVVTSGGGDLVVQGILNEPGRVTVNSLIASSLGNNTFEATIPAAVGPNDFTVIARDLNGNERASTYRVDVPPATGAYSYDDDGHLIQKSDGSATWTYEWNARDQLTRVRKNGVEVAHFSYDPLNRRIEKVAGGVTRRYVYDRTSILRETRSDTPVMTYTYIHSLGIDEPFAREDSSGNLTYYHADGLGSVSRLTDQAGAVVLARQYDAWGNLEAGADQPGHAFTGREWDPETGLYYYRARYYDPTLGRFISDDPIGFLGGINFYAYADANPVNLIDPLGLASLGDVVFFNWGLNPRKANWPKHVAVVTGVDATGTPTRAFGGWGDTQTFHEADLTTYNGGVQDNIIGTADMSGLNALSLVELIAKWKGRPVAPEWDGSKGSVCIDVVTALDAYGGSTLSNAMRQDFLNRRDTYRPFPMDNGTGTKRPDANDPSFYRVNPWLQQFFVNTGRYTRY